MHPILQHLEGDDAGGIISKSVEELAKLLAVRLARVDYVIPSRG